MGLDFVTNQEIIQAARKNLTQDIWDYLSGGAESETTMRRNRLGFDYLALRPRVCVDVSKIDTATTFLGQKLRIPVMMAPIGSLQTITPEGGVAVAKAAKEFGTMNFVSSVTQPSLEEIAASTDHPKIFQLYIRGGLDWCKEIIDRVLKAGYIGVCLTVDTAHYSRRERQMMNRYLPPNKRTETSRHYQGMLTWELMAAIKKHAGLPFILKGVATAEDAKIALDYGVDVIYVSNHGGRQLDHGRGTIDALPEIAEVADAPVALRAQAVELRHETPEALVLEDFRLVAAPAFEVELARLALRSQGLEERRAHFGVDRALFAPDVEVAGCDLLEFGVRPRFVHRITWRQATS